MKRMILKALKAGLTKTRDIIPFVGCGGEYKEFCEVLSDLIVEGKIRWTSKGYELNNL